MTKCASGFALFALATGLIVACGGSAVNEVSSSGGGAGAATAGSPGSAGATAAGGGSFGSAGSSDAGGGTALDQCSLPEQQGDCNAYDPAFWHNPKSGLCEPFVYGGCGGNANRFATRDDCIAACPGGGEDWGACKSDDDCTTDSTGCCQACEPIDGSKLLVFSSAHGDDERKTKDDLCAAVGACAPCMAVDEWTATGKYFKPACVSGQCSLLDIRESALTACVTDSDCTLRNGVNCCEGCGSDFVAVNARASFCSGGPIPCPACASPVPSGLSATCQKGHCALALPTR